MRPLFIAICAAALTFALPAVAEPEGQDDIVRLPGQGLVKASPRDLNTPYRRAKPNRLVPGGGLMMSFDTDEDGRVTPIERKTGAQAAFADADGNGDGALTALEQQAWADDLPTRDDTLANPVRFDPNLDRTVSEAEFVYVIAQLASAYIEDGSSDILIANLKAAEPKPERRRRVASWIQGEDDQPQRPRR